MTTISRCIWILPLLAACTAEPEETATVKQDLYVDGDNLWPMPAHIPVCFEPDEPGSSSARLWTQQAVEQSWMHAANITFSGWGFCTDNSRGIRIRWADENPNTASLGMNLDGVRGGMTLDDRFVAWEPSCGVSASEREFCIKAIAIHEFGHALGFAHEQNRPDTPGWCDREQGDDGTFTIGPWDPNSIMNYCNASWNNNGFLSSGDIYGVQKVYGRKPSGSIELWTGRCLWLKGGLTKLGNTLEVASCNGISTKQFAVSEWGPGIFPKALYGDALAARPAADGTIPLVLAVHPASGENFVLQNVEVLGKGGLCLDVPFGTNVPGTQLRLYPCMNTNSQKWTYTSQGELRTPGGMCAGMANINLGAPLQLQPCTGDWLQKFQFGEGSDNLVFNNGSARCIAPDVNNQLYAGNCTASDVARQFNFRGPIYNTDYGMCVEVSSGSSGGTVYLSNCDGHLHQQFELYP